MLLPFGVKSYQWKNGRTQFAPTIGFFVIVLKSAPQQTPPLPKGRGTVEDGGGIFEFDDRQKPKNPPVTFGDRADCQASATPKNASKGDFQPKHFLGLKLIDKTIFCKVSLSKE